jgi:hypothetical protein
VDCFVTDAVLTALVQSKKTGSDAGSECNNFGCDIAIRDV